MGTGRLHYFVELIKSLQFNYKIRTLLCLNTVVKNKIFKNVNYTIIKHMSKRGHQ